jgi:hypothetical protein
MENNSGEKVLFGLSKSLFWDVDITTLDAEKHAQFIIEKVLVYGNWDEFKRTLEYYGKQNVATLSTQIRYLDNIVLDFCATYFNIKKNKFRCYKHKLLNHSHWNY